MLEPAFITSTAEALELMRKDLQKVGRKVLTLGIEYTAL